MQGWGVVSRPLFSGRSNSPYPMILGTLGSGCAEAQWEMKERRSRAGCRGSHRPVPRVSLKGILPVLQLSRLFPIFPRLSRAGLGAPSPPTPPPLGTPGAASSPGFGKFVTFPAQASPRAGGALQGAIAQVRPRPPPQTAGLIWGRGLLEEARQLAHRAVLASLPFPSPGSETRRLCRPARGCAVASLRSPLFFADAPRRRAWAPPPPLPSVLGPDSARGWVSVGPRPVRPRAPAGRGGGGGRVGTCGQVHPPLRPLATVAPPPTRGTKGGGGGASPLTTFPRTAHAPSSPTGDRLDRPRECVG